jgi:hypothetical protein
MISGAEGAAIIKAEVARVVIFLSESNAFLAEHSLEKFEMDRFVVHDDAIEIKNNGAQHTSRLQKIAFRFN